VPGPEPELTPEIEKSILDATRIGNYIETAAAYAGVTKVVLLEWLRVGMEEESGRLHDFAEAVRRAQAEAEVRDVATITKAAQKDWRAAAWRLSQKFPDRWKEDGKK
jgi:hypothetical protein